MTKLKTISLLILIAIIFFAAFKYRIRQYTDYPKTEQNFDEIGYLWLGKSILTSGIPANWSALTLYNQYRDPSLEAKRSISSFNIAVNGQSPAFNNWRQFTNPTTKSIEAGFASGYKSQFLIVQPYLDNPPLTGIVFALFDSSRSIYNNSLASIRLVPILFLSLTAVIIFLLGRQLFSMTAGLFSAILYSLGPGFVITSRMAVPENLISGLIPCSLLIYWNYQKKQ